MYLSAILLYFVALGAVAWRTQRLQAGKDFYVAGRTLPARVLFFTLLAAWIGSGTLFAGAGLAYRTGFAALWQPAGAWAGIALVYFAAGGVRRLAQYTVPDLLDLRYGSAARALGAVVTVAAYMTLTAYQFRGGGRLLNLVANVNPVAGALVTAAFCTAYTAFGGMRSVASLDVVNGGMIVTGVALAAVYLLGHAGGVAAAFAALRPEQLTLFGSMSPFDALGLFVPTVILLVGEASMYQKFFSARDERAARRAVAGWLAATICVDVLLVAVAVFGSVTMPGLDAGQSEGIVVRVAVGALPAVLGMLLLLAAAAIVVSTADSFLLISSTNLVRDVYLRFVHPSASDRQVRSAWRGVVIGLGVLGFIAAAVFPATLPLGLWTYTMYGAGIVPALIAALVWPRATREGGVASIAAGMLVTVVWEIAGLSRGSYPLGLQTFYPAIVFSIVTLIVVSLRTADRGSAPSTL